jgi:hypothetical protein
MSSAAGPVTHAIDWLASQLPPVYFTALTTLSASVQHGSISTKGGGRGQGSPRPPKGASTTGEMQSSPLSTTGEVMVAPKL